jgi:hypothetical protein
MNLKCLTTFSVYSLIENMYYGLHIMMHFKINLQIHAYALNCSIFFCKLSPKMEQ